MAARKAKARAIAVPVPQDRDQAAAMIAANGDAQNDLALIATALNEDLAAIKAKAEAQAAPLRAAIAARTQGLEIWATAHRDALTDGRRVKTVELATGELKWRVTPPAVRLTDTEAIIDYVRARAWTHFLRVKTEIDKEALLKEPAIAATIPGIVIHQHEEFAVEPFAARLAPALPAEVE